MSIHQDSSASLSNIRWPTKTLTNQSMAYESLDLLYKESSKDSFGDKLGLILSCSQPSSAHGDQRAFFHKADITPLPDLVHAQIDITHEVYPGLGISAQILPVNEKLKVACFDYGAIIMIKNFGYGKTFNSEVKSRLTHHNGQICSMAINATGNKLATGCTKGEITIYQAREEEITFLTRTDETQGSFIPAMSFLRLDNDISFGPRQKLLTGDEYLLLYATNLGNVCLMDTRCSLAYPVEGHVIFNAKPNVTITSLVCPRSTSNLLVYLGGTRGEIFACDLRMGGRYVLDQTNSDDCSILRMKEVVVEDGNQMRTFIAFSNSTNKIRILDSETLRPDTNWKCDRPSQGIVRDLIQVDERIITCGDNVSIGCWVWDGQRNDIEK